MKIKEGLNYVVFHFVEKGKLQVQVNLSHITTGDAFSLLVALQNVSSHLLNDIAEENGGQVKVVDSDETM